LARKDGYKIEVSLNVSAQRDERGEILSSRSVWRDITEQKRLVEELSNHLEQLAHLARVATLNELTTGIAHDLNQPLAAIKNYAQGALIRLDKQALDAEATASILDDIIADADRAAALISSFRSLLKPSKWQPSQRSLSDLVSRLEKLTSRKLEEHRVSLAIVIPADLPLVNCDAVQIEQVLINLILNAAEAMTESTMDRTIRIQMEPMENRTVRVSVMDRAIAEQEVDVDRLFDAFYTTKAAGLGMGLAICRTIVEAHGGSLTAIPNEGPGLTLSFELPLSGKKPNE
jgi:signal transduction histidine kinase